MLNINPANPNLHVVDILTKLLVIKMTLKEDTGFFTDKDMVEKLVSITQESSIMVGVLIIAPDKSLVIFMNDKKLGLMDSHSHGQRGAIIATYISGNVIKFVQYLSNMVKQYWNTNLLGANFTILESYS